MSAADIDHRAQLAEVDRLRQCAGDRGVVALDQGVETGGGRRLRRKVAVQAAVPVDEGRLAGAYRLGDLAERTPDLGIGVEHEAGERPLAHRRAARVGQLVSLRARRPEQPGRRDAAEHVPQDLGVGAASPGELADGQRARCQPLEGADAEQSPDRGEPPGSPRRLQQDPGAGGGRCLGRVICGHGPNDHREDPAAGTAHLRGIRGGDRAYPTVMGTHMARDRARAALISLAGGRPDSDSFRHEAIAILHRAVGVDGWGWLLTDPGARLPVHVSGENRVVDQALRRFFRMLPQAWNEPGGPGSQPSREGLATTGPVTTRRGDRGRPAPRSELAGGMGSRGRRRQDARPAQRGRGVLGAGAPAPGQRAQALQPRGRQVRRRRGAAAGTPDPGRPARPGTAWR